MRKMILISAILAAVLSVAACNPKGDGDTKDMPESAARGTPYECADFKMIVAEGWQASPQTMGMVNVLPLGKTSPGLYFKFEGNGIAAGTAEASIENMISGYGGSPMESARIGGQEFKSTTYNYSGMTQTIYIAFRNGTKITITMEGTGAGDNPAIRQMLESLSFK